MIQTRIKEIDEANDSILLYEVKKGKPVKNLPCIPLTLKTILKSVPPTVQNTSFYTEVMHFNRVIFT